MNVMKLSEFCMERRGYVEWPVFGSNHCGTVQHLKGGSIPIKWWVQMICSSDSLDEQGFLVDNMAAEHLMAELAATPSALSCEKLVCFCLDRLVERINLTEPKCRILELSMSLSPGPYLYVDRAKYVPVRVVGTVPPREALEQAMTLLEVALGATPI